MLFDTSILIPYFRGQRYRELFERHLEHRRAWLSAVTLLELYAGTSSQREKRLLDMLREALGRGGFVHTPAETDWAAAGVMLARYSRRFGRLAPRDHENDLLIALGAVALQVPLATENAVHMRNWQGILRGAGMRLELHVPARAD